MVYLQEHSISAMVGNSLQQGRATSFYDQHGYQALHTAQSYGQVFTLPKFLQASCLWPVDDLLWKVPVTTQTEEIIGKHKNGKIVHIIVHGQGLLTPKRIRDGIIIEELEPDVVPDHGLTKTTSGKGNGALPLYESEIAALLDGKILPIYSYSEFRKNISCLPGEYAVRRDFKLGTEMRSGYYNFNTLKKVPRLITLAGGVENLETCLEIVKDLFRVTEMYYSHPLHDLNLNQAQGRFMEVHGRGNLFYSLMEMDGSARFLSVKPEDLQEKCDGEVLIEVP